MDAFYFDSWEVWIVIAALLGVLTSWLLARLRDRNLKKRLNDWALEDQARVDQINDQLGGRDG